MKREKLYIAGPMCFYEDGYPRWYVMRDRARVKGFDVTMPSDGELDLSHEDLRKNGDAIFENCARCMNESTAILCNLEFYRGADVDGGSVYEVGMAYARGAHCYGYTRDKRPMVWKYQGSVLRDGTAYDRKGRPLPYGDLPFSPNVVGAMKIVEGDFDDCLQVFALDREEERKRAAFAPPPPPPAAEGAPGTDGRPVVYVAGPERYDPSAQTWYASVRELGDRLGLQVIVPTDEVCPLPRELEDDPCARAYHIFGPQAGNPVDHAGGAVHVPVQLLPQLEGHAALEGGVAVRLPAVEIVEIGDKDVAVPHMLLLPVEDMVGPGTGVVLQFPGQRTDLVRGGYSGGGRHRCHDQGGGGAARAVTQHRPAGRLLASLRRF